MRVPLIRGVFIGGGMALALAMSSGRAQGGQGKVKAPPAPPPAAPRPAAKIARQANKQAAKQAAKQVPTEQLERLLSMSPEDREKALGNSKLTPAQQQNLRKRLENLDRMNPAQRATQLERARELEKLPVPRQQAVTNQIKSMNDLSIADQRQMLNSPEFGKSFSPEEQQIVRERYPAAASNVVRPVDKLVPARRQAVNKEMQGIQAMPYAERRERLHSPEFEQQYSPEEQQIIRDRFAGAANDSRVK